MTRNVIVYCGMQYINKLCTDKKTKPERAWTIAVVRNRQGHFKIKIYFRYLLTYGLVALL